MTPFLGAMLACYQDYVVANPAHVFVSQDECFSSSRTHLIILQDMDNIFQELAAAGAVNTWTYFGSTAGVMRYVSNSALSSRYVDSGKVLLSSFLPQILC